VSRALHRAFRSGVSRLRFFTVLAALVSTIAVAGVLIPVQVTATLGFSAQGGHVVLLHAGGAAETEVPEGARVVLMSSGILADERVGEGTVTRPRAIPTEVPLDALFPVTAEGVTLPAVIVAGVDLTDGNPRLPATGQARVELGVRNVWQSLWATGVTLPLATRQSERAEEDENERLRH
uniref:hypothetical protein n=1 Tax=Microbacterium sp. BF1 TaxID=2821146 RepID=UPI001C4DEF68